MTTRPAEIFPADRMLIAPVVMAAVAPIAVTRGLGDAEFALSMLVTFLFLAPAATFAAAKLKSKNWSAAILMFGGIAVGVLADAVIDFVFFAVDRNLFPFEIVYWWILGALPIVLGVVLGRFCSRNTKTPEAGD